MILQKIFIEAAKKAKSKPAFIDGTSGKIISYDKALIAAFILQAKISAYKEKNIGIMIPTSGGCMIAVAATLMAGKVPVMINYSTGALKNSVYARKKCDFDLIITSSALLEKLELEPLEGMVFIEDFVKEVSLFAKIAALLKSKLPTSVLTKLVSIGKMDDYAVILFTSGSEKTPKAVPLSHKNIWQQLENIPTILPMSNQEIFLSCLPLFHVFGFTTMFWLPIYYGCTIVTHPNPLEYRNICKSMQKYQTTYFVATPAFFRAYLAKANDKTFASMKVMVSGADNLPEGLRQEYLKRFGKDIWQGYGVTESSPVVSVNNAENHKPGSLGKVMSGVSVKIVDVNSGEELAAGKEGKILLKGDNVMSGYYLDEAETASHFVDGWYDTGDMGVLDSDGFLWHRGRLRRFVKIGGEMVSLVAVEHALEEFFTDAELYCAVAVADNKKGAYIALALTQEVDLGKVREFLTSKEFASIYLPKKQIVLDEIPLMGSGKVDFRQVEKACNQIKNGN